jgi:uncharacterized membrane protein
VRAARLSFAFLASFWIVLLLAAPLTALGVPASGLVYAFGSLICHQRPERSFHIDSAQLPVCARCFGIYTGAALGLLIRGLTPTVTSLRIGLIASTVPTAITWGSEVVGLWSPANLTRFIAALPIGAAVSVTVNYLECVRPRRTEPPPPRIPI